MTTKDLKNRYAAALHASSGRGAAVEDDYYGRLTSFDPQASFERSARSAYSGFREQLGRDVESLRGQQAGMGRLRSGFATHDEDRLLSDSAERFENMLGERAMQTTAMDFGRIQAIGEYGNNASNRYLDLLSGGLDRATAEENARRERRSQRGRGIGAALGGIAGAAFGGPAGAYAGASIGGAAGGIF